MRWPKALFTDSNSGMQKKDRDAEKDRDMEHKDLCRGLFEFIENSPSCFHVIANIKEKLESAGFQELDERADWEIKAGGKYYVTRNDSSLIAFRVPKGRVKGFHMVATHSDSPTFKIKEHPEKEVEKQYVLLNTEKYGGMILSTWLDRPLSVAGRIAVAEGHNIVTKLVNVDKDLCVIPNLAIHMNPDANKGMEYNPQVDMLPLYADCSGKDGGMKDMLLSEIAHGTGVAPEDILGQDLFLYVRDKGRVLGSEGEFILSPKLDDLQCVYASMEAFSTAAPQEYISLCAVFDNEEVGSNTRQGAASTFLEDVVARVCDSLCGENIEESSRHLVTRLIADSFLISADNAHAVHPNHPEKADPTNRPYLNGGIVIKFHGGQKYTTDAVSAAQMKALCKRAGVPWQTYANRSDVAGGSTLGNISTGKVSVATVDIGLPQLAMHSAVETGGSKDLAYAVKVFQTFWAE